MKLSTRLRSAAMRYFSSPRYQQKVRAKARKVREKSGAPPQVYYFHQVDDPYSHLAVQKLNALRAAYNLPFQIHLVSKPAAAYLGSADHFDHWALRDAQYIAADYGVEFAPTITSPAQQDICLANQALTPHLRGEHFADVALQVGRALWSQQPIDAAADQAESERQVSAGNNLRESLGHYQGAMFYFAGEWFWGLDRMRLLEQRLQQEGFAGPSAGLCVPEPEAADTTGLQAQHVLLEYFPSLRSPYTAVGHSRVLALIARSGVSVQVRPVMPMLMRGVPAPRAKQRYIISDAGREARAHSVPFGRIVDPFGEPVKKAFALFPGAAKLGKAMEYVSAYLDAAWFSGIDITTERGLRRVAQQAGINWAELQQAAADEDWQALLEQNLKEMLSAHLWGVPSFRVSGGGQDTPFACWGQDRIWRIENEIAKRAASGQQLG